MSDSGRIGSIIKGVQAWATNQFQKINNLPRGYKVGLAGVAAASLVAVALKAYRYEFQFSFYRSSKVVPLATSTSSLPFRPAGVGPGLGDVNGSGIVVPSLATPKVASTMPQAVQVVVSSKQTLCTPKQEFTIQLPDPLKEATPSCEKALQEIFSNFKSGARSNKVYVFSQPQLDQPICLRVLTCEGQAQLQLLQTGQSWDMNRIAIIADDRPLSTLFIQQVQAMANHYGCTSPLVLTQSGLTHQIGNQVNFL